MKEFTQRELRWSAVIATIAALIAIGFIPYAGLEIGFILIGIGATGFFVTVVCISILIWRAIKHSPTEQK